MIATCDLRQAYLNMLFSIILFLVLNYVILKLSKFCRDPKTAADPGLALLEGVLNLKRAAIANRDLSEYPKFTGNVRKKLYAIKSDLKAALATLDRLNSSVPLSPPDWLAQRTSPTPSIASETSNLSFILVDENNNRVVYSSSPEIPSPPSPPVAEEARRAAVVMIRLSLFQLFLLFNTDNADYETLTEVAAFVDELVQVHLTTMLEETSLNPHVLKFLAAALSSLRTHLSVYTFEAIVGVCRKAPVGSLEEALLAECAAQFPFFMPSSELTEKVITECPRNYVLFSLCSDSKYSAKYLRDLWPRAMKGVSKAESPCMRFASNHWMREITKNV